MSIQVLTTKQAADELKDRAAVRSLNPTKVYGIPWGFDKLDEHTHGIQQHEMTLLIARAGVGKSSFAGHIIVSVAEYFRKHGIKKVVRLLALEMTWHQWLHRWASTMAGVNGEDIDTGFATDAQREEYNNRLDYLTKLPIECLDSVDSLSTIDSFIRMNSLVPDNQRTGKEPSNCGFWVLDHIGILPKGSVDDRFGSLDSASGMFRQLSKDVAPSLILSQMNRKCEDRDNKRPTTGDVYGSDRMVQDSRKVFGLYREDIYLNLSKEMRQGELAAELIILKSNNGQLGTFDMTFHGPTLTWREA